ncbi:SpvB/TcaC N-terminal domain-containing protein [Nannocystis punicea]|uniref:SpvB/TcaC N-terminal domain-containing protein n=1 Tax=Nannocystis punicea TaxID=2995304 RepID=A0ABY7GVX6_9BACT|nr:SpvB/TcaC N-terminal domain-containing protein [Nannocystis poenicansa]WAS90969.1 SpvB/TcaC N-terminal domain-containing protein [Nannocystis poenicansa]
MESERSGGEGERGQTREPARQTAAAGEGMGEKKQPFLDRSKMMPAIDLPKGGGSIRGMGEKFTPSPFTGAGSFAVPIAASPGRAGFGPALALQYSSGGGNSAYGFGWALDLPTISRKTDRGLPRYIDSLESDTFILSGAEDLVPVLKPVESWTDRGSVRDRLIVVRDGYRVYPYKPRVEGLFARIERWVDDVTGESHWRTITRDNVTSYFGRSADSRVTDPANGSHVFQWLLDEVRDDRGNICLYGHKAEDLAGVATWTPQEHDRRAPGVMAQAQRYLKRIRYGNASPGVASNFRFEVVFDYGEHGTVVEGEIEVSPNEDRAWAVRSDPFSSFRAGFDLRTYRLCRRVLMFHHFAALDEDPYLVAATVLTHDETPAASFVTQAEQVAYEKSAITGRFVPAAFPPVRFGYSPAVVDLQIRALDAESLADVMSAIDGGQYRFIDLHGEGIPGILSEQAGHWYFKRNLGDGRFGPLEALKELPSTANLAGRVQQLTDLDGAGEKHLVSYGPPTPGFYERTTAAGFGEFRNFKQVPEIDWQDPNLQFIDLSGDGLPDVLLARDDHFIWYRSCGKDGFDGPYLVRKPHDERMGPALVFADNTGSVFLADMTGDGLADIVRVRNGEVAYWPNHGHGKFGRRITLDASPVFDKPDQFQPARLRLADVAGTGPTDLIYLGTEGTKIWLNQAGNKLSAPVTVPGFPLLDDAASVDVVDLRGNGTACLVWSAGRGTALQRLHFIDLMKDQKPHLLVEVDNNRGMITRARYAASTKSYLRDRLAGRPWATRLPFPVHVVERVEGHDAIARQKFVQTFAHHHGYFDGHEREFRGFGMVEQWDTESYEDFEGAGLFTFEHETVEENLHQPPVHTKTWFHPGAFLGWERVSQIFKQEYYPGDADVMQLPDTRWPAGLTPEEAREATRALAGRALHVEVYALDGTEAAVHPYTVTDANFQLLLLQPRARLPHAVLYVHERESIVHHYERRPDDPRVAHSLVLAVDAFGMATRTASVVYPRRTPAHPEQGALAVLFNDAMFAHTTGEADDYRVGVPLTARGFELCGLSAPLNNRPFTFVALASAADSATEIAFEASPTGALEKRLLSDARMRYWADDLSGPLAYGSPGKRALVYDTDTKAMTEDQFDELFGIQAEAPDSTVMADEGGYVLAGGAYWMRSGRQVPSASKFYQPVEFLDPFGNSTTVEYDADSLLILEVEDPVGNTVTAEVDLRVLAPWKLTDANGNRVAVGFDTRGVVVKSAIMGKDGANEGDTLTAPTSTFEYDLFAWKNEQKPPWVKTRARETHADVNTRWLESYAYFDGAGRTRMTKMQAAPGLAPQRDVNGELVLDGGQPVLVDTSPAVRWIGTGRTVFDNKGNPVRQYEPYFSSIPGSEDEAELVEQGVTPVLHYDPLDRLVRTELPNGTESRVEFDGWTQVSHDPNDLVEGSDWYTSRISYNGADEGLLAEKRAAELAYAHRDTPTTTHLDPQGRPFRVEQHNGFDGGDPVLHVTESVLDVQGNVLEVLYYLQDNLVERTAQETVYGMLGQALKTLSTDAGNRVMLASVLGEPIRAWGDRGFITRVVYDAARRPTEQWVKPGAGAEELVTFNIYGEQVANAEDYNLRGQLYRSYDGAGALTAEEFDFKGNLLCQSRKVAEDYTTTPDWADLADEATLAAIETAAAALLESETFTTGTTYDALSRVTTQTTPDGSETENLYDEGGRLLAVRSKLRGAGTATDFVDAIEYDAKGQRLRVVYANDTTTEYTYDRETFRVARIRTDRGGVNAATMQDLKYTYDLVGNIVEIRDHAQQTVYFNNAVISPRQRYEYDAVYRLTKAEGRETPNGQLNHASLVPSASPPPNDPSAVVAYTEEYTYDEVGNIVEMKHTATGNNWTRRYQYATDTNRLAATSMPGDPVNGPYTGSYTHDAHGNMTVMPHLPDGLTWDHADRLQKTDEGGGGVTYYVYDSAGQRVRKVHVNQAGTTSKQRLYFGAWENYREHTSINTTPVLDLERETLHVQDDTGRICLVETKLVASATPIGSPVSRPRYQYSNHQGSAALELTEAGEVISYEEYHPYGTISYTAADSSVDVSPKRYRYTGKERDEETGLAYHGARYYASWLGRWTAADPLGLGDGINRYAYTTCNPVRLRDPSGTRGVASEEPEVFIPKNGENPAVELHQTGMEPVHAHIQTGNRLGVASLRNHRPDFRAAYQDAQDQRNAEAAEAIVAAAWQVKKDEIAAQEEEAHATPYAERAYRALFGRPHPIKTPEGLGGEVSTPLPYDSLNAMDAGVSAANDTFGGVLGFGSMKMSRPRGGGGGVKTGRTAKISKHDVLNAQGLEPETQFPKAKLDKIVRNLEREGVLVLRGREADEFLADKDAHGMYLDRPGGVPGILVLPDNATAPTIVEELLHLGQARKRGWREISRLEEVNDEIEAHKKLIKVLAPRLNWTQYEILLLQYNLQTWKREAKHLRAYGNQTSQ